MIRRIDSGLDGFAFHSEQESACVPILSLCSHSGILTFSPVPKYQLFEFVQTHVDWIVVFYLHTAFLQIFPIQFEWMPGTRTGEQESDI